MLPLALQHLHRRAPHNTGVFTNGGDDGGYRTFNARGNEERSFVVALAAHGYRTGMLGKYLNGYSSWPAYPSLPT